MPWIILGILLSYFLGSIPTAYIFGRVLKGIDIRKFGSGNVGATNASRLLGKGPGIAVLILDIFKGFLAVFFLGNIVMLGISGMPGAAAGISDTALRIILGLSAILGHSWTIFLGFKGGKGIATTLGVLLGLALKVSSLKIVLGLLIFTWLVIFIITRIVSAASVLSALLLPAYMFFFKQPFLLTSLSIILAIFIILRHKSNIKRILQGKEPRLK